MASARSAIIALTFISVAAFLSGTAAQSPAAAPGPAPDCFAYLLNLSDCLTYVEAGSNLTKPEKPCCPELSNLVDTQPICLCQLLGNSGSLGVQIDVNRALKLPSVCSVSTPPVSSCSAVGVPVSVPAASEGPSSTSVSSPAAGNNDPNGAQRTSAAARSFLAGLAIAFVSTFF